MTLQRSASQSVGLSVIRPVIRLVSWPVVWSACYLVGLPVSWPDHHMARLSVGLPSCRWSVGLSDGFVGQSVCQLVGWSVCWLVCRLIHLSVGRPFGQSDCKSASVTVSQSFGQAGLICRLVTWPVGWSARPLWDDYFPEEQVTFTGVKAICALK